MYEHVGSDNFVAAGDLSDGEPSTTTKCSRRRLHEHRRTSSIAVLFCRPQQLLGCCVVWCPNTVADCAISASEMTQLYTRSCCTPYRTMHSLLCVRGSQISSSRSPDRFAYEVGALALRNNDRLGDSSLTVPLLLPFPAMIWHSAVAHRAQSQSPAAPGRRLKSHSPQRRRLTS